MWRGKFTNTLTKEIAAYRIHNKEDEDPERNQKTYAQDQKCELTHADPRIHQALVLEQVK